MLLRRYACLSALSALSAAAGASLLLAGCNVSEHDHGKNKDVDISVPFANMHVKTPDNAEIAGIGLSLYPGAVPAKDSNDKDNNAADISLSFGDFHVGVKAASYTTADSPAKVEAFYRNDMKRYGDIIKCQGKTTIGQPTRTAAGLTCDDNQDGQGHRTAHGVQVHGDMGATSSGNPELRAGSPLHQHVVGIEPKNGGTRIGLVMLDLPRTDHDDNNKSSE